MKILMNRGGIAATNCFVIADEAAKQAVLFDAPNDTVEPLLAEVNRQGWDLVGLWLTHGHFDHLADHAEVTRAFPGARILIHRLDAPKLRDPSDTVFMLPFTIPPREPDELLEDGQRLSVGALQFQVLHTPGHCAGHVMYYCPSEKILVGGDLIIIGSIGRTDLPDSDPDAMMASLRRVMQLPGDTRLLPGHGDLSSLAEEMQSNPFVEEAMRG